MDGMGIFSGIGGFELAMERAGINIVSACEIDKNCQNVLRRHFPNVHIYNDVREIGIKTHARKSIDIITGGFPCQDVSIAGKRAGLIGERSGLWFEFARIIDELEPRWVVIENVPGLLSSNRGGDFATIVQWLAKRGYGVVWRVLDAQYFGLAQRRKRVFIVASFGNGRAAKVLFERESGGWNTPPNQKTRQGTSETFTIRSGKDGGGKGYLGNQDSAMTLSGQNQWVAATLESNYCSRRYSNQQFFSQKGDNFPIVMAHGQANAEIMRDGEPSLTGNHEAPIVALNTQQNMVSIRRFTPLEGERLQGFPDQWTYPESDSQRYKQLGNAVAVPVVEWIIKRIKEIDDNV